MDFTRRIELDATYDEAILRVTAALKEQGFGVLTEIDIRKTLKEKIDVDVDVEPQIILGACNKDRRIAFAFFSITSALCSAASSRDNCSSRIPTIFSCSSGGGTTTSTLVRVARVI
jgi:hypothetical protein